MHRTAKICKFSLSPTKNSTGFGKIELGNLGKVSLIIRIRLIWRSEKAKTEKSDFKIIYLPKFAYDHDKYANFGRFCFQTKWHTWSFPMSGWSARMEIPTWISSQNKCWKVNWITLYMSVSRRYLRARSSTSVKLS